MSLGVLNNLSAVYAENNLNNTNNSLSKTLQQLSSGSRINSGADDAAGLSLVNGLQANQMALAQSQTNATEGVGLLQVADGALSQVTSLLNRAVTLATEASNGTLNSSQDAAADQEYQSILSEINNIGSTTTYNQQKVFGGADVAIYTGDSSTQSASQDDLHFAQVTSASVGDANGTMQYSAGQNVFIDSGGTTADASTDASAQAITVDVWDTLSGGVVAKTITAGASENLGQFAARINSSNLGVVATITTGAAAGDTGNADTGLEIQGNITSGTSATNPSGAGKAANIIVADTTLKMGGSSAITTATNDNAGSSSALISYQAGANGSADLTQNNLTTQAGAQATLTALNAAITDVAAQDGYIGAQINTLNAVSSVISTQSENMQSAQNAVQATDYASASSNMSKYEILSQTGISALAQANSMQQEVTKLLQ
jgi:flagellin